MTKVFLAAVTLAAVGCTTQSVPMTKPPAAPPAAAIPATTVVELKVVKLPQWQAALDALKGKVVVVDVWATFCAPCTKKFPHFVELHEKYAKDGLACVSLTVDPADDKAQALEFLTKKKATFPNFLIDEPTEAWQTTLKIGNPPQALVYGRDGTLVKKFPVDDEEYSFADVEKAFLPLLKK